MEEVSKRINSLKNGYGMVEVYAGMNKEHTIILADGCRVTENAFTWNKINDKTIAKRMGTCYKLSLNELAEQFYSKRANKGAILTVIVEKYDYGSIYQIGRNGSTEWKKHGITEGYK